MRANLVFTFIGDDHPGLIEDMSKTVADHDGNWLESEMCQLVGKFAGIIRVSAPESQITQLGDALQNLSDKGLKVVVDEGVAHGVDGVGGIDSAVTTRTSILALSIIGLDRPGILHEVTFALARRAINISQMSTELSNAPMTGEALFSVNARIELPESVNLHELQEQLDSIANELTVDINLENMGHA